VRSDELAAASPAGPATSAPATSALAATGPSTASGSEGPLARATAPSTATGSEEPLTPGAGPAQPARGRGATPTAPPPARVEAIRAGADAVLRAQAEAYWRWFTRGERPDAAAAWAGRADLLSDATLGELAAAGAAASSGEERRGLALLRGWLVGERLARDAAESGTRAADARASATFQWDGRTFPLPQARALLAGEHDRDRRRALAAAAAQAGVAVRAAELARARSVDEAARALGYPSALALGAELRGAAPDALGALAEATLARTEKAWKALLADLARRDGLALEEVRSRDLPRLVRAAAPASAFQGDRQLEAGAEILSGLGIDLAAQRTLHIDAAARPRKLTGALALALDPPADVRLTTAPVAGLEALRGFLHELGAAEALVHAGPGAVELRRLGSPAVCEAWGIVFEEVASAPAWLTARGVPAEAARAEARAAAARRLLRAREAAGRVLAELARAAPGARQDGWDRTPELRIAERVAGCPVEPVALPWPADADPLLRAAETLRAELLAAQLEVFLVHRAGADSWWRAPAAGSWLVEAWRAGGRRAPEDLSLAVGRPGIDPAALVEVVERRAGL
jgi:hypothetical protein